MYDEVKMFHGARTGFGVRGVDQIRVIDEERVGGGAKRAVEIRTAEKVKIDLGMMNECWPFW